MSRPVADDHIQQIQPYVPGKQVEEVEREYGVSGAIKLASNENPLGPSPEAQKVVEEYAGEIQIYPDGAARELTQAVADHHDVPTDQVITGNGSDQLLRLAVQTMARWGEDRGVVSKHSFGAYPIALQGHNVEVDAVEMREGLEYDLSAMADAVGDETRVVFIANPNNPTGTYVAEQELRAFLRELPEDVVAVIDEAYTQYARADDYQTALAMRDEHELLVVTRTFSKCYGMAGLRIGYAITRPEIVEQMNKVRAPFNCNRIGQKAAVEALRDEAFVERSVRVNEEGREQLEAGLAELSDLGVDWVPSQTNFLLVELPVEGREVYEAMLHKGVITRPMDGYGLPRHLRVTIGTKGQNDVFLGAFEEALREVL